MPCIDKVAINLSGQSLNEPGFMLFIQSALDDAVWPTDRLYFEITETAAVQDLDCARKFMNDVKLHGCQFALDDFGSGLSSFTYLRSLPVDCLKIEGSIVKEIDRDPVSASMVMAVKQVADVMNLETVAEYVENDAIKQKLVEIGVTYLQGWAIGKPQPLADYAAAAVDHREAATQ
jgi:Amt family ammonium transporter